MILVLIFLFDIITLYFIIRCLSSYSFQYCYCLNRTLVMRLYRNNNLRSFFSYSLILILFSPPLVLSVSKCHCHESGLFSVTEHTVSDCCNEKCEMDCSCSFSSSSDKVHGNFISPGLIQSMFKLIVSSPQFNVLTIADESVHIYSSTIPQIRTVSPIATHIHSTVLKI